MGSLNRPGALAGVFMVMVAATVALPALAWLVLRSAASSEVAAVAWQWLTLSMLGITAVAAVAVLYVPGRR